MPGLLVTGATGAIGSAFLSALARDGEWKGARLVLAGRRPDRALALALERGLDRERVEALPLDLSDAAGVEDFRRGPLRRLAPWKGALFLAGTGLDAPLARHSGDSWDGVWRVNAAGPAALLAGLDREGALEAGASVVLVSSISACWGNAGQAAYAASKGALLDLVQARRASMGARGARLNALLPPLVESPLLSGLSPGARAGLFSRRLLPDPDAASSCAAQALFLLSRRSSFVHAQIWHADSRVSSLPW